MGNLKPIGSEKLQGTDKLNRMLEIARYKENIPSTINEDKSVEYSKILADGNKYHIIKEKNGYIIKKSLNESTESDYIDPMKNRKYYSSYSQAFKRLNLIAKEVNVNEGYEKNISLFESPDEATKYILKFGETKEQAPPTAPAPVPDAAPTPQSQPTPEPAPEPETEPMPEPEMDTDTEDTEHDEDEGVTFKTIQKLTGKLAQKIRVLNGDEEHEMSSKDIKYVINSVLSALNLDKLEDEDKEDVVNKLEGSEEEGVEGGDEMSDKGNEDMGDMGIEEPTEPTPSPEGEVAERFDTEDAEKVVDNIFSDLEETKNPEDKHLKKVSDMIEGIFSESKVDDILKKYFVLTEDEKKEKEMLKNKNNVSKKITTLSETASQEMMSKKLISKYPDAKLIGKTTKKSLVFEVKNKQIKVSLKGQIL